MEGIIEYFKRITGFEPTKEQCELLEFLTNNENGNCVIPAARGFSKTLCSAIAILWYADEWVEANRPIKIMIVSPQPILFDYIEKYFKSERLNKKLKQRGFGGELLKEKFELVDGTAVYTRPATAKVKGYRCEILFVDEASEVEWEIIMSAKGCLFGDINRFIMLSTPDSPGREGGYFTKCATDPMKFGMKMLMFSNENCPWMVKTRERAKKELAKADFAVQMDGRPSTIAERAFFPRKHLDVCIRDELREGGPVEIGVDWGFQPCHTVLHITEKLGVRRKLLYWTGSYKVPIEDLAPEYAKIIDLWQPEMIKADSQPKTYQGWIERYTNYPIQYVNAGKCKDELIGQLQRKITQHNIVISPEATKLIEQLRKYRRYMRTGDDYVDSLALSIYESLELEQSVPFVYWGPNKKMMS